MASLADVLAAVMPVESLDDGALTIAHDGTFASLRPVTIAEGLDMVALTQMLVWDLPLDDHLRKSVAAQAEKTTLGTVTLIERPEGNGGQADVVLRYNFPVGGLGDQALQTLVMMVLTTGAEVRRAFT